MAGGKHVCCCEQSAEICTKQYYSDDKTYNNNDNQPEAKERHLSSSGCQNCDIFTLNKNIIIGRGWVNAERPPLLKKIVPTPLQHAQEEYRYRLVGLCVYLLSKFPFGNEGNRRRLGITAVAMNTDHKKRFVSHFHIHSTYESEISTVRVHVFRSPSCSSC